MTSFKHIPHPWVHQRRRPVKTRDQSRPGFSGRLGLTITALVGTMGCAYVFGLVALLSLPAAISSHNLTILIAWVSSNFLQLVLLPVIIVGQNMQAAAADKRAEQTFLDAEAILLEAEQVQAHLTAQDTTLTGLVAALETVLRPPPGGPQ